MGKEHARPGVAHHLPDLNAFAGCIAVDWTLGAGGFVLLERATVQSISDISKKFAALLARDGPAAVVISAEATDHGFHGPGFTLHAS
jgi:hypothetical protein